MKARNQQILDRFYSFGWHDSRICSLSFQMEPNSCSVSMEVLFVGQELGQYEKSPQIIHFPQSRLLLTDLDLLGLRLCGGMIASATINTDPIAVEKKDRNKASDFGLNEEYLPLVDTFVFEFEMIHPAGTITIFATDFQVK